MMAEADDFSVRYRDGLCRYLATRDEVGLAVGRELGRRALRERTSMLDIIEHHFALIDDVTRDADIDRSDALRFLLQTLTELDIASRGFLDGAKRYEEERARAETLAHRDEFRSALVNSLQEGFFVAGDNAAIIEINDSFAEITGYRADGLPYRWPYPWLTDESRANERLTGLFRTGRVQYQAPIRHRDGHIVWVAINAKMVTERAAGRDVYVGTLRDITAARAAAARESAVVRLATAVSVAKNVNEMLAVTLDECRTAIDVQRVVAVMWPTDDGDPAVAAVGEPPASDWDDLDPSLRRTLQDARGRLPLTVRPIECDGAPGRSRGIVVAFSAAGDVALWLEFRTPRAISAEDRLLVAALVGHLSFGLQHVRQFESARQISLTLQRAMLTPSEPPVGFAVRYEPAVSPLEIGGDWYDVLPVDGQRVAIIVGDCVGRGLAAAAVMGQLRSSARALLLTGAEPAVVLRQLDAVAALIPDAECATAFVAVLDLGHESATLQYSCAGHPPAVLVSPESGINVLADARSVPLAVAGNEPRPQASRTLTPGATLVFYTDGLVERRGESIDAGIARVGQIVTAAATSGVGAAADALVSMMAPPEGYADDVAIVVYRCPPAPLLIETEAAAGRLHDIRRRLTAWLAAADVPVALCADVVMAVNEAYENSVQHAYRGRRRGEVRLKAEIADAHVRVRVADSGSWRTPPRHPGNRGRGLPLMRAVTDRFELDHTGAGTTVRMAFSLRAG